MCLFLRVVYDEYGIWNGTDEELEEYKKKQIEFYHTTFLPYLKNKATGDNEFLSRFVQCCTGSHCLPYVIPGTQPFLTSVELSILIDQR